MTTGTEGSDVLNNDRTLRTETIDALGGDDTINVATAHPVGDANQNSTVTVDGGAGTDTLSISAFYITSLSATSAFIHDGRDGIFIFRYPTSVSWTGIERLLVSGSGYFGIDEYGRYYPGTWTTGDTADEIHAHSTLGGAALTVSTEGGDDRIYLGDVGYGSIVYAGTGNDIVDLSGFKAGFVVSFGGEGDDILIGSPVGDLMSGGPGADSMAGGAGTDSYFVDDPGDGVVEAEGGGFDWVDTTLAVYTLAPNVESLYARSSGTDLDFTLNSSSNYVQGENGNDLFRLQSGGDDSALGVNGDDVFYFGNAFTGSDWVDGGSGSDTVVLQGSYDSILSSTNLIGVETLSLQGGANSQWGDTANNAYSYAVTTIDLNVESGRQLVVDARSLGVGEDLTFNGVAETDGSFLVHGGGGTDVLTGGGKNDVFLFGAEGQWGSSDVLVGGAGIDQLALRGDYAVTFGANQLVGIEQIALVSASDTRYGAAGDRYDYNLTLADGNVAGIQMTVDAAQLRSDETLTFNGSAEDDGSFRVFGGDGGDVIRGSQNADLILGRGGADTLYGNGGNDIFRYNAVSDSNPAATDSIQDFSPGDRIDLSLIDSNTVAAGNQAFKFIGAAAFSGEAGQLRFQNISSGGSSWLVQGDVDGNGVSDFELVLVINPADPITASDFIL